jgi:hypothetical protein
MSFELIAYVIAYVICLALCTGSHLLGGRVGGKKKAPPSNLNRNLPDARVDSVFVHFLLTISICRRF